MQEEEVDGDSTVVRSGRRAMTYSDMVAFADSIEDRPLQRILEDLPGIATLSDSKFRIASNVLRRRFRLESPVDQIQLRVVADEIASNIEDRSVAKRIREVFAFDEG
jgi:hypothetical protein